MSVTFDPATKTIICGPGTTSLVVGADLYSRWKDWVLAGDNSKYLEAFRSVGGDPTTGGNSIAVYFFLLNGWKLRPQEANHTLTISGILLVDGGGDPYASTIGTYNVRIVATVPLQAEAIVVETGVSGLTPSESALLSNIPTNVWGAASATNNGAGTMGAAVADASTKVDEVHRLHGLKASEPLTVTPTVRSVGSITQNIGGNGTTLTTVTRA